MKEILNVSEMAEFLGISKPTMYAILKSDDAPVHRKIGNRGQYRATKEALLDWLERKGA